MYIMQVQDNILRFFIVFSILFYASLSFAYDLNSIKELYKKEEYRESLKLIEQELKKGNPDPELYKWRGMNYEALFDIEASIDAYKMYEALKSNKSADPTHAPSVRPTPIVFPSIFIINFPTPKPTAIPTLKPTVKPTPEKTIKPTVKPTPKVVKSISPKPTPTPETFLEPIYKGWKDFEVTSYKIKKDIKIIKKDSIDLIETFEKAPSGYEFVIVNAKIKYGMNIVIKNNSPQISIIDTNNTKYNLFAMSTYKFLYQGSKQYKKSEALQMADYYQISKKDSRSTAIFVFKVKDGLSFKNIKIMGYDKLILLKNFEK